MKKPRHTQPKVIEGQEATAVAIGCDVEVVRRARRMNLDGCLPGGRYNVAALKRSIAGNVEAISIKGDNLSLRDQKTNEEIRKLKLANDEKEKKAVLRTWVAGRDATLAERFKTTVYAKLVDELPADLSNDVATNRVLLRNTADRLLAEVASWRKESEIS